jgi:hypothetical protein
MPKSTSPRNATEGQKPAFLTLQAPTFWDLAPSAARTDPRVTLGAVDPPASVDMAGSIHRGSKQK